MLQRRWLLLLSVFFAFAGPAFGQTMSTLAVLDASGNEIDSFLVGDTVYFRVVDALANATPGVDTTQVHVFATVRTWTEYQPVYLTETGGDTGVFEGSIPTVHGIDPVQHDGVVELEPGDVLAARHDDANGETESTAEATALSDLPVSIGFVDGSTDEPVSTVYEFSSATIRVTDGAAAGQGAVSVRVSSDLRGDEEQLTLWEDIYNPGAFKGSIYVSATLSPYPPSADGFLEVTESPGPPHQLDTIRATLDTCSVAPCPTDAAAMIASSIRFLDSQEFDTPAFAVGDTMTLEVTDFTSTGMTTATLVSQSGDAETIDLLQDYAHAGVFRGSILSEEGPAVPGDGQLQVQEPDTITASRLDPLGLSSATDTAQVGAASVEFIDRFGNPTDVQFEGGWARVRVTQPSANLSPGTADTLYATLQTVRVDGTVRDSETVQLTETGPDTGIFTGQIKLSVYYILQSGDGVLTSFYTFGEEPPAADSVAAIVGTASATASFLRSRIWLVDVNGADATQYPAGGRIYVRLETEGGNADPMAQDSYFVWVQNLSNADYEYSLLPETGPDTSIFEGWFDTNLAPPGWDGFLNVQPGHTIQAVEDLGYGPDVTDQAGIIVPLQPDAVDDADALAEDGPAISIPVLANDAAAEGLTLSVSAVTQGAHGTGVINANNTLSYTPAANFHGTDSFTYTAVDSYGSVDTATVTVTVTPVADPPVAVNDSIVTNEDTAATVTVLGNDGDPDNDSLTVTSATQGAHGSAVINANGTITYTPSTNANGNDSFTYTVSDGNGGSDTATVTVNVAAVNDPPDAVNDAATTREGGAVTITVLGNDTDLEGNALSVSSAGTPTNGSAVVNGNNTITYTPGANFAGIASFTYTIGDGQGGADTATVTVTVTEALERVVVLATNSAQFQSSADVLSGDVVVNQASPGPYLNGGVELSLAGTVTMPAGWDVQADSVTVGSGTTVASHLFYNQLTNNGTVTGVQTTPLTLPVFAPLPTLLTGTPGSSDVVVPNNGTHTLAPGNYRDLIVGRNATVTFTGGAYRFRGIQVERDSKLYFSAASEVRIQLKLVVRNNTTVAPAIGSSITAANIVFHVNGVNGSAGGLAAAPKTFETGTDCIFRANVYAPNGTALLRDRTQATGAFFARDVQVGVNTQVTLQSAW